MDPLDDRLLKIGYRLSPWREKLIVSVRMWNQIKRERRARAIRTILYYVLWFLGWILFAIVGSYVLYYLKG